MGIDSIWGQDLAYWQFLACLFFCSAFVIIYNLLFLFFYLQKIKTRKLKGVWYKSRRVNLDHILIIGWMSCRGGIFGAAFLCVFDRRQSVTVLVLVLVPVLVLVSSAGLMYWWQFIAHSLFIFLWRIFLIKSSSVLSHLLLVGFQICLVIFNLCILLTKLFVQIVFLKPL